MEEVDEVTITIETEIYRMYVKKLTFIKKKSIK